MRTACVTETSFCGKCRFATALGAQELQAILDLEYSVSVSVIVNIRLAENCFLNGFYACVIE